MTLYDATLPLTAKMATWPHEPGPTLKLIKSIADGDAGNVSELNMGVHSGTHIDAPIHFIPGAPGIDTWPVEQLVGPGMVVATGDAKTISVAVLESLHLPPGLERVLFKTRDSHLLGDGEFHKEFTYIEGDAAVWLVEHGLKLVGIDYLSVEKFGEDDCPTHHTLLGARVVIVEGALLRDVPPGRYTVMALPIKLAGSDGAPARLVLEG